MMLLNRLSPTSRISLGLASMTVSVLFLADLVGLMPDAQQEAIKGRISLCEAIAIECSRAADGADADSLAVSMRNFVQRNDDLASVGLRNAQGQVIAQGGPHEAHWTAPPEGKSTATHMVVPIERDGQQWGTVEVRFVSLGGEGVWGVLRSPVVQVPVFVGGLGFFAYSLLLRRTLRQLDPSAVMPERVRIMLDSLAEGVAVLDLDAKVVFANESLVGLLGVDEDDLVGRDLGDLEWHCDGEADSISPLPWTRTLADGAICKREIHRLSATPGSLRTVAINSAPIADQSGKRRGVLVTVDDVTKSEELNVLLTQVNSSLQQEVAAKQRAQAALVEAKEAAEQADKAKSEFLANMSHEIRTPLTAMLGFAEVLEEGEASGAEAVEHLGTIRRNGKHLLSLINDILDLSKIEAGRLDVERLDCSLAELLHEVRGLMANRASQAGLELLFEVEGRIPASINTDPTRLKQILVNLIGNAIKFTQDGHVAVRTRLTEGPVSDGPLLEIDVEDTGIGIEQDKLDKIFEPFNQADASTTRRFGGTGLGLTISRRLSEALGGKLSVASTVGKGTTFTVQLDPGDLAGVERIGQAETLAPRRRSGRSGSDIPQLTGRVLLVEDGKDNQRLIGLLLRKSGLDVEIAENGKEALQRVYDGDQPRTPGFDLVLMDMQMPIMDGYAATEQLRGRGYDRPIAAISADAMSGARDRCLQIGCSDFLTKPLDRKAFYETLARHLEASDRSVPVQPAADVAGPPVPAASPTPAPKLEGRVMLAEDGADNQRLIGHLLRKTGLDVTVVGDGQQAFDAAQTQPFDLILMDVQMPVLDGLLATNRLRRDGYTGPIVALTAHAGDADQAVKCLQAGCNDVADKPIDRKAFYGLLERFCTVVPAEGAGSANDERP